MIFEFGDYGIIVQPWFIKTLAVAGALALVYAVVRFVRFAWRRP